MNNAEDLDEDEREGIRTAAVALGAAGSVRAARALALLGGVAYGAVIAAAARTVWAACTVVPLALVIVYNEIGRASCRERV